MEATANCNLEIFQSALNEIKELGQEDRWDFSDTYLEKIKSILRKIEFANKTEDIPENLRLIAHLYDQIAYKEPDKKDLSLTKKFVEAVLQHKSSLSDKFAILMKKMICNKFPEMDSYFFDDKLTANTLLKLLEIKLKNQQKQFELLCGDNKFLGDNVNFYRILEEMNDNSSDREVIVIVKPNHTAHLVPVFLRRKNGEALEILMTDSLGIDLHKDIIKMLQHKKINACVYALSLVRQKDRINCAIFTAADIIQYCKLKNKGIDLFEYAKQSAKPLSDVKWENQLQIFTFDNLPATMMKLTQYEYRPELGKEIVNTKSGETLEQNIERYLFTSKKRNYRAAIKFNKHVCFIASSILEHFENVSKCILF